MLYMHVCRRRPVDLDLSKEIKCMHSAVGKHLPEFMSSII